MLNIMIQNKEAEARGMAKFMELTPKSLVMPYAAENFQNMA
jgi:hypothetical protein